MSTKTNNNEETKQAAKQTTKQAAPYRFKTIMVADEDRTAFTNERNALSDKLGFKVTDKTLYSAIREHANMDAVAKTLKAQNDKIVVAREKAKIAKLEQKLAAMKNS